MLRFLNHLGSDKVIVLASLKGKMNVIITKKDLEDWDNSSIKGNNELTILN